MNYDTFMDKDTIYGRFMELVTVWSRFFYLNVGEWDFFGCNGCKLNLDECCPMIMKIIKILNLQIMVYIWLEI